MKEIIYVKARENYEDEVIELAKNEITKVLDGHPHIEQTDKAKKDLLAKALDQIAYQTATRAGLKGGWGFNLGNDIPVLVDYVNKNESQIAVIHSGKGTGAYIQKPDLTWTYKEEEGLTREDLDKNTYKLLMEDAKTAGFYSALSYTFNREV